MIPKKASQVVYATGSPKHNVQKASGGKKKIRKGLLQISRRRLHLKLRKKILQKVPNTIVLY
jgi:hypothetical protein